MDISVQLTCGQGQHGRSVQHEEKPADIQEGFHVPPPQHPSIWAAFCLLSPWSLVLVLFCCRLFFLLRSRREITHSGERKNSTGSTWMLWLIFSFSLKEDNSQGWRGALEKVSVALRSLDIAARPQQTAKRVYRVLFAVYSLLNASCSLIRHKFILSKPLLSHSSHTASQSTPLLSVLSLLLHFFSRPFPLQWWVGESGPFTFPESLSYSLRLRSLLCSFSQWDTESLRESFQLLKCLLHFLLLCFNVWDKVWHSPSFLKKRCASFVPDFFFFSELTHRKDKKSPLS